MNETTDSILNIKPKRKILGVTITKKRVIWTLVILLVVAPIGYNIFKPKDNSANIQSEILKKQNITSTVLATGQVVSTTDLSLSFKTSGFVQGVSVKEGDKVKAGQTLAYLDQKDALASLTTARGSLAQAQANYNKVLAGASNEDIAVALTTLNNAKASLESTKKQQQVLVDNAYSTLINSGLSATADLGNSGSETVTISGVYTGKEQGVYKISIYSSSAGLKFQISGLETGEGRVETAPQAMGTKGLFIAFSSSSVPTNNSWTVSIPNTKASTYVTNYNAYKAALETQSSYVISAENTVSAAQAALDLKKAQARPADLEAAEAQILSAQGQVQAAQALVSNMAIRAPANGTITSVDVKVGELATALKEVIVLQDIGNLHVEANVSEANVALLKLDQTVDITFDALGPDRHFKGIVKNINPGATIVSGVVNYKVTVSLENISEIKPGMTANMVILIDEKQDVLAAPSRAILSKDGKKFVRLVNDSKKKTYNEIEVEVGLEADGGLVEITSGLEAGQEVVTFIKQ